MEYFYASWFSLSVIKFQCVLSCTMKNRQVPSSLILFQWSNHVPTYDESVKMQYHHVAWRTSNFHQVSSRYHHVPWWPFKSHEVSLCSSEVPSCIMKYTQVPSSLISCSCGVSSYTMINLQAHQVSSRYSGVPSFVRPTVHSIKFHQVPVEHFHASRNLHHVRPIKISSWLKCTTVM